MKFILFFRVFLVLLLVSSSVNSQERPLKQEKKASGMSEIRVPQPESVIPGIDFCDQSCGAPSDAIVYLTVRICLIGRVSMEEKRNGLFMKEF